MVEKTRTLEKQLLWKQVAGFALNTPTGKKLFYASGLVFLVGLFLLFNAKHSKTVPLDVALFVTESSIASIIAICSFHRFTQSKRFAFTGIGVVLMAVYFFYYPNLFLFILASFAFSIGAYQLLLEKQLNQLVTEVNKEYGIKL